MRCDSDLLTLEVTRSCAFQHAWILSWNSLAHAAVRPKAANHFHRFVSTFNLGLYLGPAVSSAVFR